MTTYYDPRAARRAAAGEAAKATAEAQVRIAEAQTKRDDARADRKRTDRDHTTQRHREALGRVAAWCKANMLHLVFVPVIVVPALLAWSAIAAFGTTIYGPLGVILPLFSEGSMWAFAAATIATRAGRPLGLLRLGTAIFAAMAGGMAFSYGLGMDHGGVGVGLMMATVSVGGVIAHQLITAGPMRDRAGRDEARLARQAQQRRTAIRRAALRAAPAELDVDGTVRLLHRPRIVTLRRNVTGRRRLVDTMVPGLPVPAAGDDLDAELAALLDQGPEPAGTAQTPVETRRPGTAPELCGYLTAVRGAIDRAELPAEPSRREIQRYLGIRAETAQRVRRALHDGGEEVTA